MTQNQNSPDRCNSNPQVPSDSTRDAPNASRPKRNRKRPACYCNLIRIGNLGTDLPVDDTCMSMFLTQIGGVNAINTHLGKAYPSSCRVRENTARTGEVGDHFFHEGVFVSLPQGGGPPRELY